MPLLDKLRKLYGVGPVCSELHMALLQIVGGDKLIIPFC